MKWLIALLLLSVPAHAGGSMAPDVRVIVVHPSAVSKSISQERQITKAREASRKSELKSIEAGRKSVIKAAEKANKAYEKKLAQQRKPKK